MPPLSQYPYAPYISAGSCQSEHPTLAPPYHRLPRRAACHRTTTLQQAQERNPATTLFHQCRHPTPAPYYQSLPRRAACHRATTPRQTHGPCAHHTSAGSCRSEHPTPALSYQHLLRRAACHRATMPRLPQYPHAPYMSTGSCQCEHPTPVRPHQHCPRRAAYHQGTTPWLVQLRNVLRAPVAACPWVGWDRERMLLVAFVRI